MIDIKDSTYQEIFDHVHAALLKQGRPSVSVGGLCRYRAGNLKCAVGHCIPDDLYTKSMEGHNVHSLVTGFFFDKTVPDERLVFLRELQGAHDRPMLGAFAYEMSHADWLSAWQEGMRTIAKVYGLTFPEDPTEEAK